MNDWTQAVNKNLLSCPWSSFPGPLLVKLQLKTLKDGQVQLILLATDLEQCFLEIATHRRLVQRINQAWTDLADASQGTQTQSFTGAGEEGERKLLEMVSELVDAVRAGQARCEIVHAAYDHIVKIALPSGLVVQFVCDSLGAASASCLSTQLLHPLLGLSTSLLSLHTDDEQAIETALDISAKVERLSEGQACKNFFAIGGSGLLRHWCQGVRGEKNDALAPVSLPLSSNPAHRTAPSSTKPSKRTASSSPPRSSPKAPPPKLTMAQQMLSKSSRGERVEWDDTQPQGQGPRSSFAAKGKGRETPDAKDEGARGELEEEEPTTEDDEEPPTEDEEGTVPSLPSVQQPPTRFAPMDVDVPQPSQPTEVVEPTQMTSQLQELPQLSREEEKKAAKEQEKAEEKEKRRQHFWRARAAAEAKASTGKKQQAKKP